MPLPTTSEGFLLPASHQVTQLQNLIPESLSWDHPNCVPTIREQISPDSQTLRFACSNFAFRSCPCKGAREADWVEGEFQLQGVVTEASVVTTVISREGMANQRCPELRTGLHQWLTAPGDRA